MKTKQIIQLIAILILGILIGKFVFNSSIETVDEHANETIEEHWTCSMHPQIDLPEFGDCPICGMDLIPKTTSDDDELSENSFKMTKNAMALANIETIMVGDSKDSNNTNQLSLSGTIETNDKATAIQTAHFGGRIEKMYVKSLGEFVKKGVLIASIYSPELVSTQNELIEALDVKEAQPELYKAVRNKIKLWKIAENQILEIERTKKVITNFNLYANVSGYVDELYTEEGNHVVEGAPMFKVSNLGSVWAVFDVYEQDIKNLKMGQTITVKLNAYPDKEIKAKIDFIDPNLNTNTRTVSVRATLSNSKNKFKPGMFVSGIVTLNNSHKWRSQIVIIPKSSVLWTGKRSIVYVKIKKDAPIFEMRKVKLGNDLGENYEILSGLESGEEVVSKGTFTLDAAAQLQGKKSMMSSSDKDKEPFDIDKRFKKQLDVVFKDYISLKNNLVLTDSKMASEFAKQALQSLQKVQMKLLINEEVHIVWMKSKDKIDKYLKSIELESDIEKQRLIFIDLSEEMIIIAQDFGVQNTVYVIHCPMADDNKGADWISLEKEVRNPYFGDKMLRCGTVKQTISN